MREEYVPVCLAVRQSRTPVQYVYLSSVGAKMQDVFARVGSYDEMAEISTRPGSTAISRIEVSNVISRSKTSLPAMMTRVWWLSSLFVFAQEINKQAPFWGIRPAGVFD